MNYSFADRANEVVRNERYEGLNYIGIICILAWFYCLWFVPSVFNTQSILDDRVTYAWLATLLISGISFLIIPTLLGEKKKLSSFGNLHMVVACMLSIATLVFNLVPAVYNYNVLLLFVFPMIFGVSNAVLWLLWGEYHSARHSDYAMQHVGPVFFFLMVPSLLITQCLNHIFANMFVAFLPLISAILLTKQRESLVKSGKSAQLLPKDVRTNAKKSILIISLTMFVACAALYYTIAIIPLSYLPSDGMGYLAGISLGSIVILLFSFTFRIKDSHSIYTTIPWLLITVIGTLLATFSLYTECFTITFVIAVSVAGIFELILICYFGTLSTKGYIAAAMAYGLSSGCIRLGFFVGDGIAVFYEHSPITTNDMVIITGIIMIALVSMMLIPLLRTEANIVSLTQGPVGAFEVDAICDSTAKEFKLSAREAEILTLIAHGYTANSIAEKLFISTYTVQSHIRHIYTKMDIHKKSELLDYINMNRTGD